MTRSNKKLSRGLDGQVIDHKKYVNTYRHQVMRVVRAIENGSVEEEDMARLRNFCQMAITLMEHAPISQLQRAWRDTEILAFQHAGVEDVDVDTNVVLKSDLPDARPPPAVSDPRIFSQGVSMEHIEVPKYVQELRRYNETLEHDIRALHRFMDEPAFAELGNEEKCATQMQDVAMRQLHRQVEQRLLIVLNK